MSGDQEDHTEPASAPPEPTAVLAEPAAPLQRGRPFRPGQSGNPSGRRPGSKNRLTDVFISAIADDFAEHGEGVISRVRWEDPVAYLKIIGSFVPKELVVQREREPNVDFENITLSEFLELLDKTQRRHSIRRALLAAEASPATDE